MSAARVEWLNSNFWRTDLESVDPAERRIARYTLQILEECPEVRSKFRDREFLHSAWLLLHPVVNLADVRECLVSWPGRSESESKVDDAGMASRSRLADELLADGAKSIADRILSMDTEAVRIQTVLRARFGQPRDRIVASLARLDPEGLIHPSLDLLAKELRLEPFERCLLDIAGLARQVRAFGKFLSGCGARGDVERAAVLAACCGAPTSVLSRWLVRGGVLVRFQLVKSPSSSRDLEHVLSPTDLLREIMASEPSTVSELLAIMIEPVGASECTLVDFPHLAKDARAVSTTLHAAATSRAKGVNALLYGPPGTGKTQFALAIAAATGLRTFRVSSADADGDGLDKDGRLGAFRLAQQMLSGATDCLLVFDEVEDVFGSHGDVLSALLGLDHTPYTEKGWMNRTLEENAVPTIWITNRASDMDPAFLRRFLLSVAFSTPPRNVRRAVVQRYLGSALLPDEALGDIADDELLTPAQLAAAGRLLSLQPDRPPETVVSQGLSSMRRLLHGSSRALHRKTSVRFDPAYLNLAGDIAPSEIADMLMRCRQGRLCFYGPPGTGKTEFAHVLASAMNRELVVKRSSDILSPYVGQTEINLARIFDELDVDRAVLLLDEVDSLLRRRDLARHAWEVTQVNELLQQIEAFPGILIAATNRVEELDPAVLRRFDFKLHFRPLTRAQRRALFERELSEGSAIAAGHPEAGDAVAALPVQDVSPVILSKLDALDGLTAGDFANIVRQRELLGRRFTAEEFFRRLAAECRYRERVGSTAGCGLEL